MVFTGPGPMPSTVRLPAAICVRPLEAGDQRQSGLHLVCAAILSLTHLVYFERRD